MKYPFVVICVASMMSWEYTCVSGCFGRTQSPLTTGRTALEEEGECVLETGCEDYLGTLEFPDGYDFCFYLWNRQYIYGDVYRRRYAGGANGMHDRGKVYRQANQYGQCTGYITRRHGWIILRWIDI